MERWTRIVIRLRWIVLAAWIVLFLVGGMAASGLSDLLTNRFTLPGTDTQRTETILQDHFGQRSTGSFTFVAKTSEGGAQAVVPALQAAAERAAKQLPTSHVVGAQAVSDDVATATIVSDLEPADSK